MRQQIIQIPLPTRPPPQSTHVRPPCQSFAFEYTETPSAAADQTLPSQCAHTRLQVKLPMVILSLVLYVYVMVLMLKSQCNWFDL